MVLPIYKEYSKYIIMDIMSTSSHKDEDDTDNKINYYVQPDLE